jgi:hypothetical protein
MTDQEPIPVEGDSYWEKRCLAAEKLLEKNYKNIPDSPLYMEWQEAKNHTKII